MTPDPRDPNKPLGLRREDLEGPSPKKGDARRDAKPDAKRDAKPETPAAKPAAKGDEEPAAKHERDARPESEQGRRGDDAPAHLEGRSRPAPPADRDAEPAPGASDGDPADFERPGGLLSRVDGHLVLYHDPSSQQAEQYRACRTRLTAMNRMGAPWALVLTSSRKGEGRSVTSANLAACLAELPGTRVCLLEVDGRSPAQAELFGVAPRPGTVDLLEGRAAMKDVLRPTLLPGVDLIPAGSEPDNPAELLGDPRMAQLIAELKRRYTWVLIDAPPVHPYTDACVVTPHSEGALIVVRLGETPREMVQRTIENLRAAGGRVLGTFVTGRVPGAEDEERLGDYAYDALDEAASGLDPRAARERREAEKRLRKQELAHLKRMQKTGRRDETDRV